MIKKMRTHINRALRALRVGQMIRWVTDVRQPEFETFIRGLPIVWPQSMVRIGGDQDGGYLLPDDLDGIEFCFSPGVADSASFESDLQTRFGIQSFLADASVDGPPEGFDAAGFQKIFIGDRPNNSRFQTLEHWIASCLVPDYVGP